MSQSKTINLIDIKQALRDARFRSVLPPELGEEVQKFLKNPSCACNMPLYRKILEGCGEQLRSYFPGREPADLKEEAKRLAENKFSVINCHIDELEFELRKLPSGRKQIAVARHADQVTVIVNELDVIY